MVWKRCGLGFRFRRDVDDVDRRISESSLVALARDAGLVTGGGDESLAPETVAFEIWRMGTVNKP